MTQLGQPPILVAPTLAAQHHLESTCNTVGPKRKKKKAFLTLAQTNFELSTATIVLTAWGTGRQFLGNQVQLLL